jgi:hypothetical protein
MSKLYSHLAAAGASKQEIQGCRDAGLTTKIQTWKALVKSNQHEPLFQSNQYELLVKLAMFSAPRAVVQQFLEMLVTQALQDGKAICQDASWNRWADNWLSGKNQRHATAEAQSKRMLASNAAVETAIKLAAGYAAAAAARLHLWKNAKPAMAHETALSVFGHVDIVALFRSVVQLDVADKSRRPLDKAAARVRKKYIAFWQKQPNPFSAVAAEQSQKSRRKPGMRGVKILRGRVGELELVAEVVP